MVIFKEISVEEYLAKRSLSARDGVVYRAAKTPRSFNAETRSMDFVMSDDTIDSYGDEVKPQGCNLDRFNANPIALRNHRSDHVIGTWSNVTVSSKAVEGTMTLAAAGTSELVDETFSLMAQNILRACSVGFMPTRLEMKYDDQARPLYEFIIHEWDLYECSVVSIPANPNALAKSMKDGVLACRDMIEEVLDTYVKMPSGLIVTREDFEKAHKEGSGGRVMITLNCDNVTDDFIARVRELAGKGGPLQVDNEPEPDPLLKKLEKDLEKTLKNVEDEAEKIPDEHKDRRSLISRAIDGIRSVFKAAPEANPDTENKAGDAEETAEDQPILATEEEKEALRKRLLKYEVNDLAA